MCPFCDIHFLNGIERNMKIQGHASNFNLSGIAKGANVIKSSKLITLWNKYMHHYKNITVKQIIYSPSLLKTQKGALAFTCMEKNKNWTTINNFRVSLLMTGKIAKGHYRISFISIFSGKEAPVRCYRFSLCKGKSSLKISFRCRNKPELNISDIFLTQAKCKSRIIC